MALGGFVLTVGDVGHIFLCIFKYIQFKKILLSAHMYGVGIRA
jgi:hypothetical protein